MQQQHRVDSLQCCWWHLLAVVVVVAVAVAVAAAQLLLSLWPRTRYTFRSESVCHLCHTFVVAVVVVNVADVPHVAHVAIAVAVVAFHLAPCSLSLPNWMRRDSRCQAVS